MSDAENDKRTNLRPAQVTASTLAAVTGAFLAARIGVYGTVIGVGVISLLSTLGSEFYLRSLDRTKAVAMARSKTTPVAGLAARPHIGSWPPSVGGESEDTGPLPEDTVSLSDLSDDRGQIRSAAERDAEDTAHLPGGAAQPDDEETVYLPGGTMHPDEETVYFPGGTMHPTDDTAYLADGTQHDAGDPDWSDQDDPTAVAASTETSGLARLRRLRWPVIVGTSVVAFLLAMLVITGIEAATGSRLSGGEGSTVGTVITPDRSDEPGEEQPGDEPTDSEPQEAPAPQPDPTAPDGDPAPAPEPTQPEPQPGGDDPPDQDEPPAEDDGTPPAEDEDPGDGQDP